MIQNRRTTGGWCFSTRFGAIYSLSSSHLVVISGELRLHLCRLCQGEAKFCQGLTCAGGISAASICWSCPLWVGTPQTSLVQVHYLTLHPWTRPKSFSKVTQSNVYITQFTLQLLINFSPGTGWQKRKTNCLWQKIVSSNAELGDFDHSEAKIYGVKYLSRSRGASYTAGLVFPRHWLWTET